VQHLCDFARFETNKLNLGRRREGRILVAKEEILHEIENQPQVLGVLQITWKFLCL
jgi:hypothetical protein